MGFKKDDPGTIPKSSFANHLAVFYPCLLNGVQFTSSGYFFEENNERDVLPDEDAPSPSNLIY